MRLRPGLCPGPNWELTALPDPLAGFKGAASRRGGEGGREGTGAAVKGRGRTVRNGKEREDREREGKERRKKEGKVRKGRRGVVQ